MKSVTINRQERSLMTQTINKMMRSLVETRDPNPGFTNYITQKIFEETLERLKPVEEAGLMNYVNHATKHGLAARLNAVRIRNTILGDPIMDEDGNDTGQKHPDIEVAIKSATESHMIRLVRESKSLEYNIDSEFHRNLPDYVPFVMGTSIENNIGSDVIISDELVNEILAHNKKIDETVGALEKERQMLIGLIETCKSTKRFLQVLPKLTSIYPKTVLNKLAEKEREEDELENESEESKLLRKATSSIATAVLLGN